MNHLARAVRPTLQPFLCPILLRSVSTSPNPPLSPPVASSSSTSGPPESQARTIRRGKLRTDLDLSHLAEFPSLLHPDPVLDSGLVYARDASTGHPFRTVVTIHNAVPTFFPPDQTAAEQRSSDDDEADADPMSMNPTLLSLPHSTPNASALNQLHKYNLIVKRVIQMTSKGRMPSFYALTVAGDGDGLLAYGEGKDLNPQMAAHKAWRQAVRGLDRVERFERRTLWGEAECKFGATRVVLRPRPLGFGLRCGPIMHQVCKAAGVSDISAEIFGSRNPMNVVKASCLALWGGEARPGMGDGLGGGGRRTEKGAGVRSRDDVERARGRRLTAL